MASLQDPSQPSAIDISMGTSQLPGRDTLELEMLRTLSARSDLPGLVRFATHLAILFLTGLLVHLTRDDGVVVIPAMVLHGFVIVTLFAPMHECVHRTSFRSRWLNKAVGWIAGVGAFYNSDYYRRYHHWHHRYTQNPERDPELKTPKPRTLAEYWLRISGLLFWRDKARDMINVSLGRTTELPFVPASAHRTLAWSMRAQVVLYLMVVALAVAFKSDAPLVYWLIPALLGQPLLRAITIAEHTGCSEGADGLTNTRTTLTSWPIRLLMWNMPFHAEHHLYPSIPFHALPQAHVRIRDRLAHLDNGYIQVNREICQRVSATSQGVA